MNEPVLFHAVVKDYIVADGEVEDLAVGNVITHGFRAFLVAGEESAVVATVEWVRTDDLAELEEAIVAVRGVQFLIQVRPEVATWVVGDRVNLSEVVASIGPYEYEAFRIPDIRRRWLLQSVEQDLKTLDWLVEVEPVDRDTVEFRLSN